MDNVLYEYQFQILDYLPYFIPLAIGIVALFVRKPRGAKTGIRIMYLVFRVVGIAAIIIGIIVLSNAFHVHHDMKNALENDTALVVQGEIENYRFEEVGNGYYTESFEVNGIKFSNDFYDLPDEYVEENSTNGYFSGNGQKVLIKYIHYDSDNPDEEDTNNIVYAVQLE